MKILKESYMSPIKFIIVLFRIIKKNLLMTHLLLKIRLLQSLPLMIHTCNFLLSRVAFYGLWLLRVKFYG